MSHLRRSDIKTIYLRIQCCSFIKFSFVSDWIARVLSLSIKVTITLSSAVNVVICAASNAY